MMIATTVLASLRLEWKNANGHFTMDQRPFIALQKLF